MVDDRNLKCDFYLSKSNVVIEYNGRQHYESIEFFGGDDAFKENQKRDGIKKQYCIDNNINFEVIRYDENLEERMDEILEKYS